MNIADRARGYPMALPAQQNGRDRRLQMLDVVYRIAMVYESSLRQVLSDKCGLRSCARSDFSGMKERITITGDDYGLREECHKSSTVIVARTRPPVPPRSLKRVWPRDFRGENQVFRGG